MQIVMQWKTRLHFINTKVIGMYTECSRACVRFDNLCSEAWESNINSLRPSDAYMRR